MSNIVVTHAESGLVTAEVLRSERISPHVQRVTVGGGTLSDFTPVGYDQWFRLAVPVADDARFDNLPHRFDARGYLKYLTLPKKTRPVVRNYTVREFRAESCELDIDFIVHGDHGVASIWSLEAKAGETVGILDQGHGWNIERAEASDRVLIAADETAMPAVLGVLRSLPASTAGVAIVELPDAADEQPVVTDSEVEVRWIVREPGAVPGQAALAAVRALPVTGLPYAFAVGESKLATGVRRFLVGEHKLPKEQVTFCGYYKVG